MFSSMIGSDESSRAASSRVKHQAIIMVRFLALVEDHLDCRLKIEEFSRQIGVSSRSLRYACARHLELSPLQYLRRRRMNVARRALQQGNCMVSDVARQVGFRDLGRFAISYRKLYGEPPSITLKLASTRISPPSSPSRRPNPNADQWEVMLELPRKSIGVTKVISLGSLESSTPAPDGLLP